MYNINKFQSTLFLFINILFIAKYSVRSGLNLFISVSTYSTFLLIIWLYISKNKNLRLARNPKTHYFLAVSLIFVGIIILHQIINPYSLQVDRWSAINNFLQNLFNGIYPYSARTHLGGYGSPFPVWQAFHIPFYLIGNVGLGMLFSVILLSFFLVWFFNDYLKAYIFFILMLISPAFWYEVAVRSDLIYNFILCFIAIGFIYKKKYSIQQQALGLGILCGLFLSTRFSIVIPFAIYLFPDFVRAGIKQKIIFACVAILVFIISFLPFVFWSNNTLFFFEYNPFVLQTRQGSLLEVLIISILGIYLSTKWKKNISNCFEYIAICIVTLVTITFAHRIISDHFVNGLFDSAYDITYFNMALPFVIYVLASNNLKISTKQIVNNSSSNS